MKGKYKDWVSEDGCMRIKGWARDGLTDADIAYNIGISPQTLCEWKNRFPELDEALKEGHAPVDTLVENALLQKALAGDTTAIIFWLKNRKPQQWRDRRDKDEPKDRTVTIRFADSVKEYCN